MKKRMIRRTIVWTLALAALAGLLLALDLPHWQRLDLKRINGAAQTTFVYDASGKRAGALYGSEDRRYTPLAYIPEKVRQAFIAAEDLRFYRHHGIDVKRIIGALWQDLRDRSFSQGASTITQQLIKLTHLTSEKTLARKAQEAVLALQLERALSKDEILEAYLNTVYFGSGAYGIEAAAETYFDKPAAALTVGEGALLAGIVKAPANYAPNRNPDRALKRRNSILNTMEAQGFIGPEEAEAARKSGLGLAAKAQNGELGANAWYLDAALLEAQEVLGQSAREILTGGYRIYTALDPSLQAKAEALFRDPANFPADAGDGAPVQAAMASLDPRTGEVNALIGGRSYDVRLGLDRALQIARQPGSAIKPISVYAAAVDHYGFLPTSFADDTRRAFAGGYSPKNAGDAYHGQVTLREALSRSLNVATVDLAERVGVASVCAYAERFGLPLDKNDGHLSLALGSMTYGVSPVQLAAAYAALADGGIYRRGHLIRRIENAEGRELYAFRENEERAVTPEAAFLLTDMLKTAAQTGSARALSGLGFPVAAKTGTVGEPEGGNRDAWIAAYTPDLVACVWMGFDEPSKEHSLPASEGGGGYPARLAAKYFKAAASMLSGADFAMPSGLRAAMVDRLALEQDKAVVLASANTPGSYAARELFPANALPREVSRLWDAPARVYDLRLESAGQDAPVLSFTALDANADYLLLRDTNGVSEIAASLRGEAGERLYFADVDANAREAHAYTVIPRHRLLYEEGVLLTGEESPYVTYRPGGLLNRLSELWVSPGEADPGADAAQPPQASIFG